jgi:hypothetical protein
MRTCYSFIAAAVLALTALGAAAQAGSRYAIQIVSPADAATVFSDGGDVPVQVAVVPALAAGDQVELLVDGTAVAPPMALLDFPLNGITRGEHVLEARVIDATGNVASSSPASIFYVWQASLLFPSRGATDSSTHEIHCCRGLPDGLRSAYTSAPWMHPSKSSSATRCGGST